MQNSFSSQRIVHVFMAINFAISYIYMVDFCKLPEIKQTGIIYLESEGREEGRKEGRKAGREGGRGKGMYYA